MQWQHDLDPRDVNQASQLGKSEKAPSKASLRSLVPHSQTLRLTTQLRQAARRENRTAFNPAAIGKAIQRQLAPAIR